MPTIPDPTPSVQPHYRLRWLQVDEAEPRLERLVEEYAWRLLGMENADRVSILLAMEYRLQALADRCPIPADAWSCKLTMARLRSLVTGSAMPTMWPPEVVA
jgi:hypothetical protein